MNPAFISKLHGLLFTFLDHVIKEYVKSRDFFVISGTQQCYFLRPFV